MSSLTDCNQFKLALVILLSLPLTAAARGGGGGHGGGAGNGGGAGGGGAIGRGGSGMTAGMTAGPRAGGYAGGYRGFHGGYPGHFAGYRGYYGPRYGYYGWGGWPYYGYGLGLGVGLGYGLSAGYFGYPTYAYPYYSYGYNDPYYYAAPAVVPSTTDAVTPPSAASVPASVLTASATVAAPETPSLDEKALERAKEYCDKGEISFRVGDYEGAVSAWRHALVENLRNSIVTLQLAQGLFASGKYEEAAGATQAGLRQLPKEDWGLVVTRYQDLYGNSQDYTQQLRALERAISGKPADPALRFLAGYHYGYLGFYKQSIDQLEKAVKIESRDEMSRQLKDVMKRRMTKTDTVPPAPVPAKDL